MDIKTIVFIFDSVKDCTETVCDGIGTNLCNEFNKFFNIKIAFGGNAVNCGSSIKRSLEEFFLTEDVINLAMASYFDAINDQTFFQDAELLCMYFGITDNVHDLFTAFLG